MSVLVQVAVAVAAAAVLVAVAAVVNHVTVAALFLPVERVGPPVLGWQGWLPRHAHAIADRLVDQILTQIVSIQELYQITDPERIRGHLVHSLHPQVGALLDRVMLDEVPEVWDQLPDRSRRALTAVVQEQLRTTVDGFVNDLGTAVEDLFDPHHLVRSALDSDPSALARMFHRAGSVEFRWLRNAGWQLGLVAALVPTTTWMVTNQGWPLPVLAGIVGLGLNGVALHTAFRPLRATPFGPWQVQGSLPARQHEAAVIATREILARIATVKALARSIFEGTHATEARAMARIHTEPLVRAAISEIEDDVADLLTKQDLEHYTENLSETIIDVALSQFDDPTFNVDRQIALERVLAPRVQSLPPDVFEDLFRPAIRPIEWAFIAAGGAGWALTGGALALVLTP